MKKISLVSLVVALLIIRANAVFATEAIEQNPYANLCINDPYFLNCIEGHAVRAKNPEICTAIRNKYPENSEDAEMSCRDTVLGSTRVEEYDDCKDFSTKKAQDYCYKNTCNTKECCEILTDEWQKGSCQRRVFKEEHPIHFCYGINIIGCIADFGYRNYTSTVETCSALKYTDEKDSCFEEIAKQYGTISYCNYITTKGAQLTCREKTVYRIGPKPFGIDLLVTILLFVGLYYLKKRAKNKENLHLNAALNVSLIYLILGRILLSLGLIFAIVTRFFDLLRILIPTEYIAYNWLYLLFFDLITIGFFIVVSRILQKAGRTPKQTQTSLIIIYIILIAIYALGIVVMAPGD